MGRFLPPELYTYTVHTVHSVLYSTTVVGKSPKIRRFKRKRAKKDTERRKSNNVYWIKQSKINVQSSFNSVCV